MQLPAHLKRYVVEQDYSRYTPEDQAVWRYVMHQLRAFLSTHAHSCYLEGLNRTGIEVDRIPEIAKMSEKLEKFGWHAVPVSGFIPPAAFMELQAHGFLPIASDMRSVDHMAYTPAPDIVHEAAGHAPILVDEEFAGYLKAYAQVARRAIISREDMNQYEAIRILSDIKEAPESTPEQIKKAEDRLTKVTGEISHLSEAALLGRMNWWTAEYGLIGDLKSPRIFGAGLLSSLGEAQACLHPKVKKIPLSLDCINYTYDITEMQPQLFVTPNFHHLYEVLEDLAKTMAFRLGGIEGLKKAKQAETVNTVELNSGLQISGRLKEFWLDGNEPAYLQFEGPTQLCEMGEELAGHGKTYHAPGFGSPVGFLENSSRCISEMNESELAALGIKPGLKVELKFKTGARVRGEVTNTLRSPKGKLLLISFKDCLVTREGNILFDPSWGTFDMAVGSKVTSVFGGPADRIAYGETEDFAAKLIPRRAYPEAIQEKHRLYAEIRKIRADLEAGAIAADQATADRVETIVQKVESALPHEWLMRLELFELGEKLPSSAWQPRLSLELDNLGARDPIIRSQIDDGLRLLK